MWVKFGSQIFGINGKQSDPKVKQGDSNFNALDRSLFIEQTLV